MKWRPLKPLNLVTGFVTDSKGLTAKPVTVGMRNGHIRELRFFGMVKLSVINWQRKRNDVNFGANETHSHSGGVWIWQFLNRLKSNTSYPLEMSLVLKKVKAQIWNECYFFLDHVSDVSIPMNSSSLNLVFVSSNFRRNSTMRLSQLIFGKINKSLFGLEKILFFLLTDSVFCVEVDDRVDVLSTSLKRIVSGERTFSNYSLHFHNDVW